MDSPNVALAKIKIGKPKGLEAIIDIISKFVINAQAKTNAILYGKGQTRKGAKGLQKVIEKGVLKTLEDIANVDFCNLLNYLATQAGQNNTNVFNPEGPQEGATPNQKKLWTIQNYAFKIQQKIDGFYSEYGSATGQDSRLGLVEFINSINLEMNNLLSPSTGLNDPEILKQFPEMSTATNYLSNALNRFNSYTNVREIPINEVQKVINFIDKVRIVCTSIVALNNPTELLNSAFTLTNGKLQEDFNRINQFTTPGPKVIALLKDIIKQVNNVNTVAKKILGYINFLKSITKFILLFFKALKVLKLFLVNSPIPASFLPSGVILKLSNFLQNIIEDEGIKKFIKRLRQLNLVFNLIAIFVTSLIAALDNIIRSLTAILLNIKSCNRDLTKEVEETINDLNNTKNQLEKFINDYNDSKNNVDKTFGGYTIEIVTEEITDESINLKRRFGIARGANNIIAVQSTPTFASLDLIIINEVKVLLISKGLVNLGIGELNSEQSQILVESLNYLGESDVTLSESDLNPTQIENLLEDSNTSDISTFMNNLPGGKALRNKVRKRLTEQKQKLGTDLKGTNPN